MTSPFLLACVIEQTHEIRFVCVVCVIARCLLSRIILRKSIMSRKAVHTVSVHTYSLLPATCSYPDLFFFSCHSQVSRVKSHIITHTIHTNVVGLFCDAGFLPADVVISAVFRLAPHTKIPISFCSATLGLTLMQKSILECL